MLPRYTLKEMGETWSANRKFYLWLEVELAVLRARKSFGDINVNIPEDLNNSIKIDPEEIALIEEVTGHDLVAFLRHVSPQLPDEIRPFFHEGLTSYDIEDTALALQIREALEKIMDDLYGLMRAVKKVAMEYKYTPQVGRTHGVHAEPITFGVKLANWYSELARHNGRLDALIETVSVGKISGAVGMYTLDPCIEKIVCKELELTPVVATQIIARDIISECISVLANLGATISKIAENIRLMAQTDVREVMEPFGEKQTGSSAMPHKQNPNKSERICGLMGVLSSYPTIVLNTQARCWYERSLDNSSEERIIIPDAFELLDYCLFQLTKLFEGLRIFPDAMKDNLEKTLGLTFSQEVMMLIAERSGFPREDAHTLVKTVAINCFNSKKQFLQGLLENDEIMSLVSREELEACFDLSKKIKYTDYIFEVVFAE